MAGDRKDEQSDSSAPRVNPGYAGFQLARALITEESHEDLATRERARLRAEKWTGVLTGLLTGALQVGSRTPIADVPGWATVEVLTGGFATGQLLAAGPLQDHERALLANLPPVDDELARQAINTYYLTDEGLRSLQDLLQSGRFGVTIPEEGALLVVAWLAGNGHSEIARDLLDELTPWFPKLRFYPVPTTRPSEPTSLASLENVGDAIESLLRVMPNRQILAQTEAITVWEPLYDRMVGLFLETVEGESPHVEPGPDGSWTRAEDRSFRVEGGWPCQRYPDNWRERAGKLLGECEQARREHWLCGRPDRKGDSFAQLLGYLRWCVEDPEALRGRDVGRIRLILARHVTKRGAPDSARCVELRAEQARQIAGPTYEETAKIMAQRLGKHPADSGLEVLEPITRPVTAEEQGLRGDSAVAGVPEYLARKVRRCLIDSVDGLVGRGIITSGETLARVLPQVTSWLQSAGFQDPSLLRLYSAIYKAFRRRRSLLLLNLEKQVQIEELPWVAAIDRLRVRDLATRDLARQALKQMSLLAVTSFPQAIVPNKLLQELRGLAKTAELDLPLVDELAADIFMGAFSHRYRTAAQSAAELLDGTLYATYFGIDYSEIRLLASQGLVVYPNLQGRATDPLLALCESRAGVRWVLASFWSISQDGMPTWSPAVNGMIIEQQQILTSQNLAVLFAASSLADALGDGLEDLARRCFVWICRRLQMRAAKHQAQLIQIKNAAYAWRQMVFYLALLSSESVQGFLRWAEDHLASQPDEFRAGFLPALKGLTFAAEGRSLDDPSAMEAGARRFLGWSVQEHWLLSGRSR